MNYEIELLLPTNCLSVFDHFVGLALKDLIQQKRTGSFFFKLICNPSKYSSIAILSIKEKDLKTRWSRTFSHSTIIL